MVVIPFERRIVPNLVVSHGDIRSFSKMKSPAFGSNPLMGAAPGFPLRVLEYHERSEKGEHLW